MTVIRPGALGDTLLALPALALLRAWAPGARLTFIARADMLPLALASGLADEAWAWDLPDWAALFDPLTTAERLTDRARAALVGVDVVVAWAPDAGGALADTLTRLGRARVIVAPGKPPEMAAAPALKGRGAGRGPEGPDARVEHAALWLARALGPLGITPPENREELWRAMPPLRWPETRAREAERVWRGLGLPDSGVIALHPGAGAAAKRWPAGRFAALAGLAREHGYTPLLLAGPADGDAVAATLAASEAPLPVARGLGVAALAPLLARCASYMGNDSGVAHLAGMFGVPTVAVFGPTDPARWSPLGPRVRAVRAPEGDLTRLAPEAVWAVWAALMRRIGKAPSEL